MKIIYLVLDGAAGDPALGTTAYMASKKPFLDNIARKGVCGMAYTVRKGVAPESDVAVLSILGYDPEKDHPGRGPLEALGLGMELKEGYEIAFRGNFATVNPDTLEVIDRRAGRTLGSDEAHILAKDLDGLGLDGGRGYARVKASIGHRVSVIIGHKEEKLSDNVGNTDPAYKRVGRISVSLKEYPRRILECKPLEQTRAAEKTCNLVDEFTAKSIQILREHEVNRKRLERGLLPANAILLRDAGGKKPVLTPISKKYKGLRFKALVEMPVEAGISRAAGMEIISLPAPTGDYEREYAIRAEKTLEALDDNTVVYAHLKGPDEPGHDGSLERKKEAIEKIDKYYMPRIYEWLERGEGGIIITSDHATPWQIRSHSDAPVPVVVYKKGIEPDSSQALNEIECTRGSLGTLETGNLILRKALEVLGDGE
jgi:2,3-bisphosphoglycerate-independent phosphoglycerate mutase